MYALVRLEWDFFRNNVLEICRSPARLALWAGYAFLLVFAAIFRIHASLGAPASPPLLNPTIACAIGGAILATLGGSTITFALGHVGAFRSRAEALLFVNVGLSSRAIALWLQVRKLLSTLSRWLWTIVINFVIFLPAHARSSELARGFLASIMAAMLVMSLEIPVFLLGRMKYGMLLVVAGTAAGITGLGYVLLGLGATMGNGFLTALFNSLPFSPASVVYALVDGPQYILTAFSALPLLVSLSMLVLGRDAIPEFYAASVRWFTATERNRSLAPQAEFSRHPERFSHGFVPPGPLVLIWKDWLAFRRRRGATLMWLVLLAISLALGTTMAALVARTHHESDGWTLLLVMSAFVYFVPLFASVGLADDVGKPLFWMTTPSLLAGLTAWTVARSWRGAVVVSLAPLVAGLGMNDNGAVILSIPIGVTLWFSLNAIGVFVYSLFPSRFDARGPLFFVRLFVAFALLVPGLFVCAAALMVTRNPLAAMVATGVTLALEAALCLILAASMLQQNGAGIAMLERAS